MNPEIYRQYDNRWANLPYPGWGAYLSDSGCGCLAVYHCAIELQKYAGSLTVPQCRDYMVQYATVDDGTLWSGITQGLEHYGFTAHWRESDTMDDIFRELKGSCNCGVILFAKKQGPSYGPDGTLWTTIGHYIAFSDYKIENGQHMFYLKDSGPRMHDGWYSFEKSMRGCCRNVWICKSTKEKRYNPDDPKPDPKPRPKKYPGNYPSVKKYLEPGDKGENVIRLQQYLDWYYNGAFFKECGGADGVYGGNTLRWVKKMQTEFFGAKEADGLVGPKTIAEMKKRGGATDPEPAPTPKKYTNVIDVSNAQDDINWKKVKANGIVGVMVRCGYRGYEYGILKEDSMFMKHIKGASAAGLKLGIYFYTQAINYKEGQEEADYAISLLNKAGVTLYYPIAIDSEYCSPEEPDDKPRANNLSKSVRTQAIKGFCDQVKARGYSPMIYANLSDLSNKMDLSKLPFDIWCAQWDVDSCQFKGNLKMWQYTSKGRISGVNGNVDRNKCYITKASSVPTPTPAKPVTIPSKPSAPSKDLDKIALEVIDGKWGSGDTRVEKLKKAGYDPKVIQQIVNEIFAGLDVIDGLYGSGQTRVKKHKKAGFNPDRVQNYVNKIIDARSKLVAAMTAWGKSIANNDKYSYKSYDSNPPKSYLCPICDPGSGDGWNCIGLAFAIWHHGGKLSNKCRCDVIDNGTWEKIANAKTDAEALLLAKKHVGLDHIRVIRNKGLNIPKNLWQPGDICGMFVGDTYQHTYYNPGDSTVIDSSSGYSKANQIAVRSNKSYSARVIIRYTGWLTSSAPTPTKKPYSGKFPEVRLVKSNAKVIADAIKWAKWIAGDNRFHYGYGEEAHHNGCYFCETQAMKQGHGIVDPDFTYCCNPFVGAAWAHGGCIPRAISMCQNYGSWDFGTGSGSYHTSNLFTNLGKPNQSSLKAGDVLCNSHHVALYVGGGKIAEAGGGDDNVRNSRGWNNSIRVTSLDYDDFDRVYRYNSSVNADVIMCHGEVSDRIVLLQEYLNWYTDGKFFKECGGADGYYGDNTFKYVKKMQTDFFGAKEADGKIGPKTIAKMKAVKK